MKGIVDDVNMPISLGHADFHPRNIIINEDTGNFTFVDYESSGLTYQCSDLARLFDVKQFYENKGFCEPEEPDMTEDILKIYCRDYLMARNSTEGLNDITVSEEEIQLLRAQTRIINAIYLFTFLPFALSMVDIAMKELNLLDPIPNVRRLYAKERVDLLGLHDCCIRLQHQITTK